MEKILDRAVSIIDCVDVQLHETLCEEEALDTIRIWLEDHLGNGDVTPKTSLDTLTDLTPTGKHCLIADMLQCEIDDPQITCIHVTTVADLLHLMQAVPAHDSPQFSCN